MLGSSTKQEVLMEELVAIIVVAMVLYAAVSVAVSVWSSIGRVAKNDEVEN
jgi:type II secretory pathway component PulJ